LVEISHTCDSKVDTLNEKLKSIINEKLLVQKKITDITQKLSEIDDNLENDILEDKMKVSGNTDHLTEMLIDLDSEFAFMKELEKTEIKLLTEQLDLIPGAEFTEPGRNPYWYEDNSADNILTATIDCNTSNNYHEVISNSANHNTNKYDYNDNYANDYDINLNTMSNCDKGNDYYKRSTNYNTNNYNDNYVNNYDINYNVDKKIQNYENLSATIQNENNGDLDDLEPVEIDKSNDHHINKLDYDGINVGCGCSNIDNNNYNNGNNNHSSVDYNDNDNIHDDTSNTDNNVNKCGSRLFDGLNYNCIRDTKGINNLFFNDNYNNDDDYNTNNNDNYEIDDKNYGGDYNNNAYISNNNDDYNTGNDMYICIYVYIYV
jgi:hypothetical protein